MANPKLDPDRIARVLIEAELVGDASAAKRAKISLKTVGTWRRYAAERPAIAEALAEKRKNVARELGREMLQALRAGVLKMQELIEAARVGEPGVLREVAGAVKILTDAQTLREVVHGQQPDRPEPNPKPPAPPGRAPEPVQPASSSPVH